MVSSVVTLATWFFSRRASASPAGVFANIASCKCLTNSSGELKTTDCTTNLQNFITPTGDQSFFTDEQLDSMVKGGEYPTQFCVGAVEPPESLLGQRAEIIECDSEGLLVHSENSKLVTRGNHSYELKIAEDDTLIFAEPDDADDHLFEFHCALCSGDEGWSCGGASAPAPVPSQDPTPSPAPAPSTGMQIQWENDVKNLCIDLPGGDTSNGALLWMWDCYGGDTQMWSFQEGQLVYAPDPSKCVDLLGGDTTNGNSLGIWDCNHGDSQLWGFDSDWGTIYLANSTTSDAAKCATIGGDHGGVPIHIWDCNAHDGTQQQVYQSWKVGLPEPFAVV